MDDDFRITQRKLPHWRLSGATYYVTWCLHPTQPPLAAPERTLVMDSFRHFAGERYDVHASVVMDDHVHLVVEPLRVYTLSMLLHSWKSYTAHAIVSGFGRTSPIWQHDSFDRIIRDQAEYVRFIEYIVFNLRERWPDLDAYEWVWGSAIAAD
jgi:REP element-mobilizing transposase RayT